MKIMPMSDLHFEFHADGGTDFLKTISFEGVDVLILAGDIGVRDIIYSSLLKVCEKAKKTNTKILYVSGNHELWYIKQEQFLEYMRLLQNRYDFKWLQNKIEIINGERFLGTTLWFEDKDGNDLHSHKMADFHYIPNFNNFVYQENAKAKNFLKRECKEGDIVITHHVPSAKCIPTEFKGSELNRFFICDLEKFHLEKKPKYHFFGHTHFSFDTHVGETRLISNPFGYALYAENPNFNPNFVLEL